MQLSPRREVGEFRKRYKWMALTALVVFSLLIGRMAQLQLVQHDEWARIARERGGRNDPATAASISSVSIALHTPGRCVLALIAIDSAIARSAAPSTYTWQMP